MNINKSLKYDLEKFNKIVIVSLKQVAENRRFVDVSRLKNTRIQW